MEGNSFARAIVVVAVGAALLVAVVWSGIYVVGSMQRSTADYRGGTQKKERVEADGDYRIAQYDHFYELCSSIQAKNEQIENTKGQLKYTDDPDDEDKLNASVLALENSKEELVQEYNADAASNGTKGKYRASDLPYQIDPDDEEVQCGSAR